MITEIEGQVMSSDNYYMSGYHYGVITGKKENGTYILDMELDAVRAISCIVVPDTGDYVNYCETEKGRYILNILQRNVSSEICLNGPDSNELTVNSKRFRILSEKSVEIVSCGDITISSIAGTIVLNAQNFLKSIVDSAITLAQNCIIRAVQISTDVEQVCRIHSCHHIITADKDVRIDGERINMG
jgi:hypothetical protein